MKTTMLSNRSANADATEAARWIQRARQTITERHAAWGTVPERLRLLALNEAEALAWQSGFPHLVFPDLADEKLNAVAQWARRQERLRQDTAAWSLAA